MNLVSPFASGLVSEPEVTLSRIAMSAIWPLWSMCRNSLYASGSTSREVTHRSRSQMTARSAIIRYQRLIWVLRSKNLRRVLHRDAPGLAPMERDAHFEYAVTKHG